MQAPVVRFVGVSFVNPVVLTHTETQNLIFLPPATKLGQGNIFSSVCQEFCPQGGSTW